MNEDEIKVLNFLIKEFKEEIIKRLVHLVLEYENIEKPIKDDEYQELLEFFGHILSSYKADFENITNDILKNIDNHDFNINLRGIVPTTFYRQGRGIINLIKIYMQENNLNKSFNRLVSTFEDIDSFYYSNAEIIENYIRR